MKLLQEMLDDKEKIIAAARNKGGKISRTFWN